MNRELALAVERQQQWELIKTQREILAEMQDLTAVLLSINR